MASLEFFILFLELFDIGDAYQFFGKSRCAFRVYNGEEITVFLPLCNRRIE